MKCRIKVIFTTESVAKSKSVVNMSNIKLALCDFSPHILAWS